MKNIIFMSLVPALAYSAITLQDSYVRALDYETKVQSYSYQMMAKKEDIVQAKSQLYPKIDLISSAISKKYKLNNRLESDIREDYFTLKLVGELPIYNPEHYNNIDQAELKYNFSEYHKEQLKQKLASSVTRAFMLMVRAENSLIVAQAYLDASEARHKQIRKMYDKNLSNKMDFLESKVVYRQAKVKVSTEKQNLNLAKFQFKNITGIKNPDVSKIDIKNINISKLPMLTKKDALNNTNIDIKKSNLVIELTKKQIKYSTYGHYPKVNLTAFYAKNYSVDEYTVNKNDSELMLSIKIPIYKGGHTESQIAKHRYFLSASNEDLIETQRKISSEYEELTIILTTAQENIVLNREAIESANLYLHAVRRGYENGLKNLIDVEDAKTKLYEAHFKLIDSGYEYIISYTSILALFGILDSEKLSLIDDVLFERQ